MNSQRGDGRQCVTTVRTDTRSFIPLDYVVVLDFEATCDERGAPDPQEIIDFPSVLLSLPTAEPIAEFASCVRPQHHPTLTAFCTELTGITQAQVDAAPPSRTASSCCRHASGA